MAKALGQLQNAPLIYVLAEIRFTHIPRMDNRWEDFHEMVLERYPEAKPERIERFVIKDGKPAIGDSTQLWNLMTDDRSSGIVFKADSFSFHTVDYSTSNDFIAEFESVLKKFEIILPEKGVRIIRLGLRYIDLLIPENNILVDEQVIDALRMPKAPTIGSPVRMEQMVIYESAVGGNLAIRHRQSVKPDVLPGDVFPNHLKLAPRLAREKEKNEVVGLLDYDHYIENEVPFDVDKLIDTYRGLHKVSSTAFKETTTAEAQKIWKQEN